MGKFDRAIESAELKAKARLSAFERKSNEVVEDPDVVEFKRGMVKAWMSEPEVFEDLMRLAPKEMNNLVQKYGKGR